MSSLIAIIRNFGDQELAELVEVPFEYHFEYACLDNVDETQWDITAARA